MNVSIAKKVIFLFGILITFLIVAFKEKPKNDDCETFCRQLILRNLDEIALALNQSTELINNDSPINKKINTLKEKYHAARVAYKKIEFFIEYYSAFEAKFYINGPLVPKIEMEISSEPFYPHGFQVLEENLFDDEKLDPLTLKNEYVLLHKKINALSEYYTTLQLEQNKIEEAIKLQFIRLMSLTMNGYDCTINKEAIKETAHVIEGLEEFLKFYETKSKTFDASKIYKQLLNTLKQCIKQLKKNPNSDTFNRLDFVTNFLNPAYIQFQNFCEQNKSEPSLINYAVNFNVGSFLKSTSINKQHFSVYRYDTLNIKIQSELGKLLFFDPLLSGNNKRACASCHQAEKAFTDGLDKSLAYNGVTKISRNSPTLINASYQKLFFHDGRAFNLEEQADGVFNNTFEMNSSSIEIISKLKQSREYKLLFNTAFKNQSDSAITFYAVLKSISEFIKTLDSRNSKFDRYLNGDKTQLSPNEKNGYNLFSGKALCGSCHFFPMFNGTVPPMFNENEFEILGVPELANSKILDSDIGREAITKSEIQKYAFKTPTLRNIELTAPYMHNGVYNSLDSVLVFYNRGGGAGIGLPIKNQTLPFDSLGLSQKELNDLKLFLLTLTDVSNLPNKPNKLPKFNNEILDKRKIGGEY